MAEKFPKFNLVTSCNDLPRVKREDIAGKEVILFDTNFLFVAFKHGIDVIREIERIFGKRPKFYIMQGTIGELYTIEEKKDKDKKFLPLISKMLHTYSFSVIESKETYVDEDIIRKLDQATVIATNDKKLRRRVKGKNGKVLLMRQMNHLVLE